MEPRPDSSETPAPDRANGPPANPGASASPESTGKQQAPAEHGAAATGDAARAPAADGSDADSGKKRRRRRRRRKPADGSSATPGAEGGGPGPQPRPGKGNPRSPGRAAEGRPRRGRPGRGRPGKGGPQALDAVEILSQLADSLLKVEGVDLLSRPRYMDVNLRIPLDVRRDGKRSAEAVVTQILERVGAVREHEQALSPGAVYCFFSGSAGDHSRPEEPRHVFEGYSSTGKPNFTDFVTMAIERKDAGIDELLAGEDVVLTHVTMGQVLRTQQLAEFGNGSAVYRILGQVDAGLFPVLTRPERVAFSFQLLRGSTLEGKPRLRLHPVGVVDLSDLADPSVLQILSRFQQKLDEASLRLQGKVANEGEVDEEEFVLPLLQDLARQLSGRARRKNRRTDHADERAMGQQRPTAKASEDAAGAADAHILWDDAKETVVILGPKGRVHVFTGDARHVTSLAMTSAQVQKRKQAHRWRPAEPDERGEFRLHLKRRLASEDDAETTLHPAIPRREDRTPSSPPATAIDEGSAPPAEPEPGSPESGSSDDAPAATND